ncbi:hypothetical protein MJO29_011002 [Puccinia striiformis f. sp. tritici]|uniref:Phosphoglycerate mutase n=1 Tax=Puccinia striiformis TaxID=27350 RepID=A0A2S4WBP6_9BASI|nr:hypothetical protein Pst134EA_033053 [Puccinia striiformis f. sp. tritici]KAH9457019.1 hypothetical protein Pst134EA_033053 [Puccinia striiformis f. sp. tritici]KAI7946475.1 hypothetical protein MJO29_011002 [Puccinia striiformis f. sp. tritici]POW19184.1 hypothetical protein PSHT_04994 [Puccinia striiformis]
MSKNEQLRTITLTLVRHGESTDNITPIWAGHRDSTLTNFGHSQAQRLGESFKDHYFHRIFCSDLKRANLTANQIRIQNLKNPINKSQDGDDQQTTTKGKINDLIVLPLLREQNFGEAEGERWDSGRCTVEGYYTNKGLKFKDGESRDDVMNRAARFEKEILVPEWLSIINNNPNMKEEEDQDIHFCIVSHGIFLIEFLTVLKNLYQKTQGASTNPEHFSNTGWERIKLTRNFADGQPEERVKYEAVASNVVSHLDGLKRQPGGIGNLAWDPKQSKIDSFFSSK